jgi:hypothetical protein
MNKTGSLEVLACHHPLSLSLKRRRHMNCRLGGMWSISRAGTNTSGSLGTDMTPTSCGELAREAKTETLIMVRRRREYRHVKSAYAVVIEPDLILLALRAFATSPFLPASASATAPISISYSPRICLVPNVKEGPRRWY